MCEREREREITREFPHRVSTMRPKNRYPIIIYIHIGERGRKRDSLCLREREGEREKEIEPESFHTELAQ